MRILILIGSLLIIRATESSFSQWRTKYHKNYDSVKALLEAERNFENNIQIVQHLNLNNMGGEDVIFELNNFADLSGQEFESRVLLQTHATKLPKIERQKSGNWSELPSHFDWRTKGAVSSVKDQGTVGTCWAFSTLGNIEGLYQIKTGLLKNLSAEQLVDCDSMKDLENKRADCGRFGGWPYLAYQSIILQKGIDTEEEYPYCIGHGACHPCMAPGSTEALCGVFPSYCDDVRWPCRTKRSSNSVQIRSWTLLSDNEEEIQQQLIQYGPLSVLVNASMLQYYRKGIWNPVLCDPQSLNHAVLLVGYGEENDKPYWIIKNSWGADWGENGYYRLIRNKGKCGINTFVTSAIL